MYILNIALTRQKEMIVDPLAFLLWPLFRFDVCVALSGYSNGEFSRAALETGILPHAGFQQTLRTNAILAKQDSAMDLALKLEYESFMIISKLSHLSGDFRMEMATMRSPGQVNWPDLEIAEARMARINEIRNELLQRWNQSDATFLIQRENMLAREVRDVLHLVRNFEYENSSVQFADDSFCCRLSSFITPSTSGLSRTSGVASTRISNTRFPTFAFTPT